MPRQLQSSTAPAERVKGIIPINKGGTGVASRAELISLVGGIDRSLIGKAGGLLQGDASGKLPASVLSNAGITLGHAITGPSVLVHGTTSIFTLTNYNTLTAVDVTVDVGTVTRNGAEISVTAPSSGESLTLTIDKRKITLPMQGFAPVKPSILYPTSGTLNVMTLTAYTGPYTSVSNTYSPWTEVTGTAGVTVTLDSGVSAIECEGRRGENGTAYVDFGSKLYQFGLSETTRLIERTTESTVTFHISGTGSLRYRTIVPSSTHVSTDWQVASDPDFTTIVKESLADTVNLTRWDLTLTEGQYYIRSRFNGSTV